MYERKRIGEILADLGVLTPAEVERVVQALRRRPDISKFGQVAREMGLLREEHILAALAVQMELFPRIQEMSLKNLLGKLQTPPSRPLPLGKVRARLGSPTRKTNSR